MRINHACTPNTTLSPAVPNEAAHDAIFTNESIGRLHRVNNARKIALHSAIIEDALLAPVPDETRSAS